jgi:hypothetical protein
MDKTLESNGYLLIQVDKFLTPAMGSSNSDERQLTLKLKGSGNSYNFAWRSRDVYNAR